MFTGQGFTDQGFTDQGFTDQGFTDQGFTVQGFTDQGFTVPGIPAFFFFPNTNLDNVVIFLLALAPTSLDPPSICFSHLLCWFGMFSVILFWLLIPP